MAGILIVDDDAAARELLTTVLGYAGHAVTEASDGAEALRQISVALPELIIVDLLMPNMNGIEFVRALRQTPAASIPVIFYTASYLESEAQNLAKVCGVSSIITKPAEPQRIFAAVQAALGERPTAAPAPASTEAEVYLTRLTAALSQKAAHVVPRLESMIALGLRLASERDPQRLLADFCDAARKIIGAKVAMVAARHSSDGSLRFQFVSGQSHDAGAPIAWDHDIYRDVMAERRPRRLSGLAGDASAVGLPEHYGPVHSFLCVPIQSPLRVYGWLTLLERVGATSFSDEDEALAQILAAQVGRIYENGSLYREVRSYAERLEAEIAERRQAQEEIRALNADLEERIRQRTAQLLDLNAELEAFGYTVSHDLRAPLRTLNGYSSLILETESDRLSPEGRRYLQATIDGAQRMSHMLDDLLEFSRFGRQSLRTDVVDMKALALQVWEELVQQDSRPATLRIAELPNATGDAGMLREVWTNLLSNALKYSSKNPQRAVDITGRADGEELTYTIADNGAGFDMSQAHRLFRVFERLHTVAEFAGTGAGLAIVERIVRRHGGRIWAESAPGQGARFHFTLPVAAAAPSRRVLPPGE